MIPSESQAPLDKSTKASAVAWFEAQISAFERLPNPLPSREIKDLAEWRLARPLAPRESEPIHALRENAASLVPR
ncbi:hypothetical protein [Aureimonas ureilytica]|uniref:hypothetical protein n=1 Tax=Aureimonas ureilytica TaxID=401562 RepID=UPI00138B16AE|nr:hypothetical protein [Aureimonas ureilytica]